MQTKIFWMRVSKFQTWNNFFWWCGIDWWILSCLYMLQAWRADQWASDSAFLGKINHNLWTISPNTDIWFFLWLFKMSLSRAICRQFFWFISYGEYSSSSKQIPPKPAWVCPPYVPSTNREGQEPQGQLCPWNSLGKGTGVGCHFLLQGTFQPRDWIWVSCIAGRYFTNWATREVLTFSPNTDIWFFFDFLKCHWAELFVDSSFDLSHMENIHHLPCQFHQNLLECVSLMFQVLIERDSKPKVSPQWREGQRAVSETGPHKT